MKGKQRNIKEHEGKLKNYDRIKSLKDSACTYTDYRRVAMS